MKKLAIKSVLILILSCNCLFTSAQELKVKISDVKYDKLLGSYIKVINFEKKDTVFRIQLTFDGGTTGNEIIFNYKGEVDTLHNDLSFMIPEIDKNSDFTFTRNKYKLKISKPRYSATDGKPYSYIVIDTKNDLNRVYISKIQTEQFMEWLKSCSLPVFIEKKTKKPNKKN